MEFDPLPSTPPPPAGPSEPPRLRFAHANETRQASVSVVADLSINHGGSVDTALSMVNGARAAGLNAVNMPCYSKDTIADAAFRLCSDDSVHAIGDIAAALHNAWLSDDDLLDTREEALADGLPFIATLLDARDADLIASLNADGVFVRHPYDLDAVHAAAQLSKPLLIGIGGAEEDWLSEVAALLKAYPAGGCVMLGQDATPASDADAAMGRVAAVRAAHGVTCGYTDRSTEPFTGAIAVAAGACVVEKRFTLDREAAGPFHAASLDPIIFTHYADLARRAARMVGLV